MLNIVFSTFIRMHSGKAQTHGRFAHGSVIVKGQSHRDPHEDDCRCYALGVRTLNISKNKIEKAIMDCQ